MVWSWTNAVILYVSVWILVCRWISNRYPGGWFGTFFIVPYIGNFIIPTDFHIFQRGGPTTNQDSYGSSPWFSLWLAPRFHHNSPTPISIFQRCWNMEVSTDRHDGVPQASSMDIQMGLSRKFTIQRAWGTHMTIKKPSWWWSDDLFVFIVPDACPMVFWNIDLHRNPKNVPLWCSEIFQHHGLHLGVKPCFFRCLFLPWFFSCWNSPCFHPFTLKKARSCPWRRRNDAAAAKLLQA